MLQHTLKQDACVSSFIGRGVLDQHAYAGEEYAVS